MLKDTPYFWPLTLAVAVHAGVLLPGAWQSEAQLRFDPGDSAVLVYLPPSVASSPSTPPPPPPEVTPEVKNEALPAEHEPMVEPTESAESEPSPVLAVVDPPRATVPDLARQVESMRQALADARQAATPVLRDVARQVQSQAQLQTPVPPAPRQPVTQAHPTPAPRVESVQPAAPESPESPASVERDADFADPGVFSPDAVVNHVKPLYPAVSRRRGEQGTAVFLVSLGPDGRPREVTLQRSSGHARLDAAALAAAHASTYRPAQRRGLAVATRTTIAFTFQLTDGASH